MPMYYFNVADGSVGHDEDGVECAGPSEARELARRSVPGIVGEQFKRRGDNFAMTINVRDANGQAIYSGTLSFAGGALPRQRR